MVRLPIVLALMLAATPARAGFISAPDVVVYCEPAIGGVMQVIGDDFRARSGVPVRVLTAPGTLLRQLLVRGTRDDILVTLVAQMDEAVASGLVEPLTRIGPWRDPVVLATRNGGSAQDALRGGRIAVIDPVAADRMDGPATVARLGWPLGTDRLDGMASGQEVASAVEGGSDAAGLLHRSDLAGHDGLDAATSPDAPADLYAAALSHGALSRHGAAFLTYLDGPEAGVTLQRFGLTRTR